MYDLMLEPDREFPVKANMYRHQTHATLFVLRLFDLLPGQQPASGGHGAALLMEIAPYVNTYPQSGVRLEKDVSWRESD